MRVPWLTLATVLGIGSAATSAFALGSAEYIATRSKTSLTSLDLSQPLANQMPDRSGQVIEVSGVVSGIFTDSGSTGFLLRVKGDEILVLRARGADPDITIGNTLRVLGRIPAQGVVLDTLALTKDGPSLAKAQTDAQRAASTPRQVTKPAPTVTVRPSEQADVPVFEAPSPAEAAPTPSYSGSLAKQPEVVAIYANKIREINGRVSNDDATEIAYHILAKSEEYGVDPRLVFAMIQQESRFNRTAVSGAGARGLGQLMPGTAAGLGVRNVYDVEQNLDGSIRYLADQLNTFGHITLALAAYNAGPGNVRKAGNRVPRIAETQNYVRVIWRNYCELAGLDPDTGEAYALNE